MSQENQEFQKGENMLASFLDKLKSLSIKFTKDTNKKDIANTLLSYYMTMDKKDRLNYTIGIFILLLTLNVLTSMISSFILILYPIYATLKSIKTIHHDKCIIWLIYWVIYVSVTQLEYCLPFLLVIPYYYIIKITVMVIGFMDLPNGYNKFSLTYNHKLTQLFEYFEDHVDKIINVIGVELDKLEKKKFID